MRSIIEEISEAERRADEIRQQAVLKAREDISFAQSDAEAALSDADRTGREATREALLAAERDGDAIAQTILDRMNGEAEQLCAAAEAHTEEAVQYLLKKVTAKP